MKAYQSHGSGVFEPSSLASLGRDCVWEHGVLVFHPENVHVGTNVYVGHRTILKGYHRNEMRIGDNTWIGQDCFFHSAGGLEIGQRVGIGPGVRILTSTHAETPAPAPIMAGELVFAAVSIGDGSDIGIGATILPGVQIGRGVQVGAGAVVDRDLPDYCVAAGVPARVLRMRSGTTEDRT